MWLTIGNLVHGSCAWTFCQGKAEKHEERRRSLQRDITEAAWILYHSKLSPMWGKTKLTLHVEYRLMQDNKRCPAAKKFHWKNSESWYYFRITGGTTIIHSTFYITWRAINIYRTFITEPPVRRLCSSLRGSPIGRNYPPNNTLT